MMKDRCFSSILFPSLLLLWLFNPGIEGAACQSCLFHPIRINHHNHFHTASLAQPVALALQQTRWQFPTSFPELFALQSMYAREMKLLKSMSIALGLLLARRYVAFPGFVRVQEDDGDLTDEDDKSDRTQPEIEEKKPVTSAMVGTIGFYKNFISPLLPPACRFLPTCSQYGVQAIEQFGPTKGVILTAWRLMRCSPLGGKGYDPPKWPPVAYTYSSY